MDYILDGDFSSFAKAVVLLSGDFDREKLLGFGNRYKRSGRLLKAMFVARDISAGKLNKNQAVLRIRRLAGSAGNPRVGTKDDKFVADQMALICKAKGDK